MMILSPEELVELTQRERSKAQARALTYMGIEYRIRPDGSVVVLRSHVDALLGIPSERKVSSERKLDLSTIR